MQGKLVIRDEIVRSCVTAGRASYQQLESAEAFGHGLADAAGTNGPLSGTLRDAAGAWRIRRQKLLETLKKLVDSIEAIDKAFKDADEGLGNKLKDGAGQPSSNAQHEGRSDGASQHSGLNGGGHPAGGPKGGGGSFREADFAPLPSSSADGGNAGGEPSAGPPASGAGSDKPGSEIPPLKDGSGRMAPSSMAQISSDGMTSERRELIRDFAARWSALTGKPAEEVATLLAVGLGGGGLVAMGAAGAILASQQLGAGGLGRLGVSQNLPGDVGTPNGQKSAGDDQQSVAGEQPGVESLLKPDADSGSSDAHVSSQPNTNAPGDDTPTGGQADSKVSSSGEAQASDELKANDDTLGSGALGKSTDSVAAETSAGVAGDTDGISATDLAALKPADEPSTAEPLELPALAPSTDSGNGGGASAAGGSGLDLPPLQPLTDSASELGGSASSVETLPDLAPADPMGGTASVTETVKPLPDLSVIPAEPNDAANGRVMGGPMMGGMMSAGAGAGPNPAVSGTSVTSAANSREFARQAAKDVLGLREGAEER